MNILAFDTALGAGQVALWSDDGVLQAVTIEDPRSLAEQLVPTIDLVIGQAGIDYRALDKIAVTVGPGTFTGLRIGLAAARAIGLAADRPVIGITTLEALANGAADIADSYETIIAAIDARRGQIYFQAFRRQKSSLVAIAAGKAIDLQDIEDNLPEGPVLAVGSGAAYVAAARPNEVRMREEFSQIDTAVLCRLALDRLPTGVAPAPLYLRDPDAKLPQVS